MKLSKSVNFENILLCLLFILPFHYLLFDIFLNYSFLKIWKEVLILSLTLFIIWNLGLEGIRKFKNYRNNLIDISIFLLFTIFLFYIAISPIFSKSLSAARVYVIPTLMYFIGRHHKYSNDFLRKVVIGYSIILIFIFVYGVIQQFILGPEFLIDIGYRYNMYRGYPRLPASFYLTGMGFGDFQRFVSVFVSSNTAGMFIAILVLIIWIGSRNFEKSKNETRLVYSAIVCGSISLVLTFSRSSWISMIVVLFFTFIFEGRKNGYNLKRKIGLLLVTSVVVIVLDAVFLKFAFSSKILSIVVKTVTLQDSSIQGHLTSFIESMNIVFHHPLGLGLGRNGPRALAYMTHPNLTESSYFLIAYEIGVFGLVTYIFPYIYLFYHSIKNSIGNVFSKISKSIALLILVGYTVLPYVQEMEITIIFYLFIGLYFNNFRKEKI